MQPQCENCGQNRPGKDFSVTVGVVQHYEQSRSGNTSSFTWRFNFPEKITGHICDDCQAKNQRKYILQGALWLIPPIAGVVVVLLDSTLLRPTENAMIAIMLTWIASIYTVFFMPTSMVQAMRAKSKQVMGENLLAKIKRQYVMDKYALSKKHVVLPSWYGSRKPREIGAIKLMNQQDLSRLRPTK